MNKTKLFLLLRIVISLLLLALLLFLARANLAKIGELLKSVDLALFSWGFLIFLLTNIFMAWRLQIVLAAQKIVLKLKDLLALTLIGYFFTNFMPTAVGGDLVKGYYISKKDGRKLNSYTAILFDRVIGMFSIALIAGIALVWMRQEIERQFIAWAIILLLLGCLALGLALIYRGLLSRVSRATGALRLLQVLKIDAAVKKIYGALSIYLKNKQVISQTLGLSLVTQVISFYSIFIFARSLGFELPWGRIILIMPLISIISMLPVTLNGLGLREWGFVFFFGQNIGAAGALSLSVLYLAAFLLTSLIGGITYLFWR